jgi:hypothetical protein
MERQKRLLRDSGPAVVLLLDMVALYRGVGSAEVMAEQCGKLAEVSQLETVTLQYGRRNGYPAAPLDR